MKRFALAACLALIAAAGINASVGSANSHGNGALTCKASVKVGDSYEDLQNSHNSSDPVLIDPKSGIPFRASVSRPIATHSVVIDFVVTKIDIKLPNLDPAVTSWDDEISASALDDFDIGPGLYNLIWTMKTDEDEECKVDGLLEVDGNLFTSPIGIAATASLLLGGVGIALTVGKDALATLALAIRVTIGGKVKKGEEPGWYGWLKPRADWSLGLTLLSSLAGLLFGIGNAVFLQQAAIAPLSFEIALQVVLPSVLLPPALSSLTILNRVIHQQ